MSVVSRKTPRTQTVLDRSVDYLNYTMDMGILYKTNYKKDVLECYSDVDHGEDSATGRSTTGVVHILEVQFHG